MKKCGKCNYEIEENANFCHNCGTKQPSAVNNSNGKTVINKQDKKVFMVLIAGLLVVMVITQSIYLLFKRKLETFATSFFTSDTVRKIEDTVNKEYKKRLMLFDRQIMAAETETEKFQENLPVYLQNTVFESNRHAALIFREAIDELLEKRNIDISDEDYIPVDYDEEDDIIKTYYAFLNYYTLKHAREEYIKVMDEMYKIGGKFKETIMLENGSK